MTDTTRKLLALLAIVALTISASAPAVLAQTATPTDADVVEPSISKTAAGNTATAYDIDVTADTSSNITAVNFDARNDTAGETLTISEALVTSNDSTYTRLNYMSFKVYDTLSGTVRDINTEMTEDKVFDAESNDVRNTVDTSLTGAQQYDFAFNPGKFEDSAGSEIDAGKVDYDMYLRFSDGSYIHVSHDSDTQTISVDKYADTEPEINHASDKNVTSGQQVLLDAAATDPDYLDRDNDYTLEITQPDGDTFDFSALTRYQTLSDEGVYTVEYSVSSYNGTTVTETQQITSESERGTLIISDTDTADISQTAAAGSVVLVLALLLFFTRHNL